MKKNEGITLIALTVTIMILLILAGITISVVFSDDGIIKKAKEAANMQNEATKNMQNEISDLTDELKETLGERKIEEVIGKPARDRNQILRDNYGNYMTLPAGFTVVPNGINNVEYTYTGDGIPAVQDGIVIQDSDGNQFVWIPIGTIYNKEGDTTIELARYTFNTDGSIESKVIDGSAVKNNYASNGCMEELENPNLYPNAKAINIEEFKTSARRNAGYYLARYEASNNNGKAELKQASVWTDITQLEASEAARNMYAVNSNITSDLTNSYAWDTAIVFIQEYSGISDYSMKNARMTSDVPAQTGANGDKVCNINDMSSNYYEWTTETYLDTSKPCYSRGGDYGNSNYTTSSRNGVVAITHHNTTGSFRTVVYLK